jgi:phospholipid/cholesterol/gamma-HCH transport system permease protein
MAGTDWAAALAEISMGAGTLATIGGTVVIVGFLTLAAGGALAAQGYSSLGNIGIESTAI